MGQAKLRRQQLGSLYGTPEGSNKKLKAYIGGDQHELDQKALKEINAAKGSGQPVILIGTEGARSLASAAGLAWLHEIPEGEPIPESFAWDPAIAEKTGIMPPSGHESGGVVILAAGATKWLEGFLLDGFAQP
jgi:hypothetical protein